MNLTKRRALELTEEMWDWLSKNPDKFKEDFLDNINCDEWPLSSCYCCEYAKQNGETCCEECPLAGYAWDRASYACTDTDDSPYLLWKNSYHLPLKRSIYAATIRDAARKALDDLRD